MQISMVADELVLQGKGSMFSELSGNWPKRKFEREKFFFKLESLQPNIRFHAVSMISSH